MTVLELGGLIGQVVTFLGMIVAIILAIFNKKARTPADDQARQAFAYQLIKERLEEANADRQVLTETVNFLRDQATKRDTQDADDFEREQARTKLIRDLNANITKLTQTIQNYEQRLASLADKVRSGRVITLVDIYGEKAAPLDTGELAVATGE